VQNYYFFLTWANIWSLIVNKSHWGSGKAKVLSVTHIQWWEKDKESGSDEPLFGYYPNAMNKERAGDTIAL